MLNIHETDKKVAFDEPSHTYTFEGKLISRSVTTFIAQFFESFESELIAHRMITGKNWPRPGYIKECGTPYTKEEILAQWTYIGETASNRGTWMHYNIERYLNGLSTSVDIPELEQFMNFHQDVIVSREFKPFRTEWRIVAPDLDLAGSVDLVVQKMDGSYAIIDWKRSKNLPTKMTDSYGKKGKPPISHLPDCDGSKYFLQQNIYKYILEKYYDINITEMLLVSMHPEFDKYFLVDVPDLGRETLSLMEHLAS